MESEYNEASSCVLPHLLFQWELSDDDRSQEDDDHPPSQLHNRFSLYFQMSESSLLWYSASLVFEKHCWSISQIPDLSSPLIFLIPWTRIPRHGDTTSQQIDVCFLFPKTSSMSVLSDISRSNGLRQWLPTRLSNAFSLLSIFIYLLCLKTGRQVSSSVAESVTLFRRLHTPPSTSRTTILFLHHKWLHYIVFCERRESIFSFSTVSHSQTTSWSSSSHRIPVSTEWTTTSVLLIQFIHIHSCSSSEKSESEKTKKQKRDSCSLDSLFPFLMLNENSFFARIKYFKILSFKQDRKEDDVGNVFITFH